MPLLTPMQDKLKYLFSFTSTLELTNSLTVILSLPSSYHVVIEAKQDNLYMDTILWVF